MAIDPNIPLGVRPVQLENPMNALAQAQQFGVNALKMQEAEQVMAERNALRGLDINAPDYISQVGRVNPKLALELQKGQLETKRGQVELEGKLMANARNTLAPINDQGTYDLWRKQTSAQLPGIAPFLPPKFDDKVKTSLMLEADKYIAQTQISASQQQTNATAIRGQDLTNQRALETQRLQFDPTVQGNIAGAKTKAQEAAKREVAGDIDVTSNRKALAQAGYDVTTGKDDITDLIKKSTGSYIGKAVDISGRAVGKSTQGSEALAALEQKANAITFGLLNGKLGAGISKSDAELVASLVGRLGDGTLPVDDRLAAWDSAKNMMKNLGMVAEPTGSPKPSPKPSTPTNKTPKLPSGFNLD
jgi:hypothetical protein